MTEQEKVLVFPEFVLSPHLNSFVDGILRNEAETGELLADALWTSEFMDRPAAEVDPTHKQIIPYCVVWTGDEFGTYVLGYKRTKHSGEGRLHEKWSIGVGGHINPIDGQNDGVGRYCSAIVREIEEEVGLKLERKWHKVEAVIYDDSNDVGKVHLGVVHYIRANGPIETSEPGIDGAQWLSRKRLLEIAPSLENWSQKLLPHLSLPGF